MFLRFFSGVGEIDGRDERRVEIVVVQLGHAHHRLAQIQVAMEGRQTAIHTVDEVHVHRCRNVRSRRAIASSALS